MAKGAPGPAAAASRNRLTARLLAGTRWSKRRRPGAVCPPGTGRRAASREGAVGPLVSLPRGGAQPCVRCWCVPCCWPWWAAADRRATTLSRIRPACSTPRPGSGWPAITRCCCATWTSTSRRCSLPEGAGTSTALRWSCSTATGWGRGPGPPGACCWSSTRRGNRCGWRSATISKGCFLMVLSAGWRRSRWYRFSLPAGSVRAWRPRWNCSWPGPWRPGPRTRPGLGL